jgi:D-alanyl-D-alanine carboxypeptidase
MTTFLLMSFAILQYIPYGENQEALLMRTPKVSTKSWAVFDTTTGEIRYGNDVDTERPIASITKLFTAYMIMWSEVGTTKITLTEADINTEGEFGKLKKGETLSLASLMFPLLIESSNDAGAAIERTFGPLYSEAVDGALSTLGLTTTHIVDGTGLSPEDVSTPRDLAKFFTHVKTTYPRITDITQLRMYITDKRGLVNNNPARTFSSFVGGKQGYIPEAGKTFVGAFKLPDGKKEVGIVLLGSDDIRADIERILKSLK